MKINLFEPHIDNAEEKAVLGTLRSKFWASGAGVGNVSIFENKFKNEADNTSCGARILGYVCRGEGGGARILQYI